MLQEAEVLYGYIITDEQLWLVHMHSLFPAPKECPLYISGALPMGYTARTSYCACGIAVDC